VEGSTDVDILRGFALRLGHPVANQLEENHLVNVYYVQDNFPNAQRELEAELERVEGGFGIQPVEHFFALRRMLPQLRGLAILDNDGRNRTTRNEGGLEILYWSRYEGENFFVTPAILRRYAEEKLSSLELFAGFRHEIKSTLDKLILERVFANDEAAFQTYSAAEPAAAALIWTTSTARVKLSDFAEEFYRRLGKVTGMPMLLRKGDLHLLIPFVNPNNIIQEVREKLNALQHLLTST
jgi:hypothetical protein